MSIGKSALELPSSLSSLENIYQRHLQDLKVLDSIEEELACTVYVMSHEGNKKDA